MFSPFLKTFIGFPLTTIYVFTINNIGHLLLFLPGVYPEPPIHWALISSRSAVAYFHTDAKFSKVFNVIKLKARAPSRMYILYMHWFFPRCLLNMLATGSQYLVSALLSVDTRENFWIWRHHESWQEDLLLSRWTVMKRFHNFTWLHTSLTFFRGGFNIFHQSFLQGWNKSNIITFFFIT